MLSKIPFHGSVVKTWDGLVKVLPFTAQCQLLMTLEKKPFENIVGKRDYDGIKDFSPFP